VRRPSVSRGPRIGQRWLVIAALLVANLTTGSAQAPAAGNDLEIIRPVHTWEFADAVGMRAGLFGTQDGRFEAWVYPLKLLRDFHLVFKTANGHEFAAESLARTIAARPESVTITYVADEFTVDETWFVPVDVPAAVVKLRINTWTPLRVEAHFRPDMQMMWPAVLGKTHNEWNSSLHAFALREKSGHYFGLIGALGAGGVRGRSHPKDKSAEDVLVLPESSKGSSTAMIVIAGSVESFAGAEATYRRLPSNVGSLQDAATAYYRQYLARTTSIEVPDANIQRAYDWARISTVQGMVTDPLLGTGLIAGYRTAGKDARPGFAWFFGRDSEWTSFALDSVGDFANVRTALEFLAKYQRQDGKVEHEIAQSAPLVPWFTGNYAYASADATPLFLIAVDQYVRASGDSAFVRSHWDNLWRAYTFLRSTWDAEHHAQNAGVGHGWVEGGPLLPVKSELYQSGLGAQAVLSLADMARLAGHSDLLPDLQAEADRQRRSLDSDFWSDTTHAYAFALDKDGHRLDTPSVLTTVPMWFDLLNAAHVQSTLDVLAGPEHMTDWGMRIVSAKDPRFYPSGYHYGSVWPLFTGWASVGEYRYHRPLPAYANLKANALLTLSGSLGRTTEVVSGSVFEPLSASSPHQIWSSAMVISPILRGMLGLESDGISHTLSFAPHVPATWKHVSLHNVWVGSTSCDLAYDRSDDDVSLRITAKRSKLRLRFAPEISLRARVLSATVNGLAAGFQLDKNSHDQHVTIDLDVASAAEVHLHLQDDFALEAPVSLPPAGKASHGVRVIGESWNEERDQLQISVSGLAGSSYDFAVRGASQIASVENATVSGVNASTLHVEFPGSATDYVDKTIVISFKH
jgi:GH15 family glucan-1,4-alpha-glucosidase